MFFIGVICYHYITVNKIKINIMNKIKLKERILYIAEGTVLIRDHKGDFFPSISDSEYLDGPIIEHPIKVKGEFILANPHIYEIVTGEKNKAQLIREAIAISEQSDVKDILNQALMAREPD